MAFGAVTAALLTVGLLDSSVSGAASQAYTWKNVKTGGQYLYLCSRLPG